MGAHRAAAIRTALLSQPARPQLTCDTALLVARERPAPPRAPSAASRSTAPPPRTNSSAPGAAEGAGSPPGAAPSRRAAARTYLDDAAPARGGLGRLQERGVGLGRSRRHQAASGEALPGTDGRDAAAALPPPTRRLGLLLLGAGGGVGRRPAGRPLPATRSLCHHPAERRQLLRGAAGDAGGEGGIASRGAPFSGRRRGGGRLSAERPCPGAAGGLGSAGRRGAEPGAQEARPQPRSVVTGARACCDGRR